jgi:asparagine synthase (glutamine-hydrolysing)
VCGIAGEIRFDGRAADADLVAAMTRRLAARGPDGEGVVQRGPVALGHRRLKIIDLSDRAAQPMVDDALGLTLVFNGCIYNYPELRTELEALGHSFATTSDTEVILKSYAAWGEHCVEHFNGMFAFVLLEHATGGVFAARDRLGIKPFYYAPTGKALHFASTLPALLPALGTTPDIDPIALHHYMTFHSVVPAPRTILSSVRKLPPATRLTISPTGQCREEQYWQPHFHRNGHASATPETKAADIDEALKEEVLAALSRAVRRRMIADVPVGVLLSGGVDSSLVVALLAEQGAHGLNTFTIGFESAGNEEGNEFKYSDLIAERFDTVHHKLTIGSAELVEHLPACFRAMSEPMVSHDNIAFYLLSQKVSEHVKVVQSGQGADEIFGGYFWYPPMLGSSAPLEEYAKNFFDRTHAEMSEVIHPRFVSRDYSTEFVESHFDDGVVVDPVDKALRLDTTVMLIDDPVKRVDNMTMAWGLEARVPFLDHELVELAATIAPEMKVAPEGKFILKEAARKILPHEIIDRPKGYFPVPELKYLNGHSLDFVKEALHAPQARERELYQQPYLDTLLQAPAEHLTPLRGSKLWQLATLEIWLQTHGI